MIKQHNYTANTLWLISERVLRLVLTFVINILIARHLGTDNYGLLNYIISIVGLLLPISLLGFDVVLVKEFVIHKKLNGMLFYTAFCMMISVSLVVVIALWIYADIFEVEYIASLLQIYSLALLFNPVYVIDYLYQANVMVKYSAIAFFLQSIFSAAMKLCLLILDMDLYWFVIAYLMDSVFLLFFLGGMFVYRKDLAKLRLRFSKTVASVLIKRSLPLVFSGVMVSVYMKIDQVMLMWLIDQSAVGVYAAAVRLSEAWYFLPIALTASLFPMILGFKNTHEKYLISLQKLMDILVFISICVALMLSFFSDQIVELIYGNQYEASADILAIHAWSGVFVCLGLISGKWLVAENLHSYAFYRTLVGALINILLNSILIPKYGVIGAAIATLIAQISAALIYDIFFTKTREMFLLKLNALMFISIIRSIMIYVKKSYR